MGIKRRVGTGAMVFAGAATAAGLTVAALRFKAMLLMEVGAAVAGYQVALAAAAHEGVSADAAQEILIQRRPMSTVSLGPLECGLSARVDQHNWWMLFFDIDGLPLTVDAAMRLLRAKYGSDLENPNSATDGQPTWFGIRVCDDNHPYITRINTKLAPAD